MANGTTCTVVRDSVPPMLAKGVHFGSVQGSSPIDRDKLTNTDVDRFGRVLPDAGPRSCVFMVPFEAPLGVACSVARMKITF